MNDREYLDQKQHEEPQQQHEEPTRERERPIQHRMAQTPLLGAAGRLQRFQMYQAQRKANHANVADFLQAKFQMQQQKPSQTDAIKQTAATGLQGASTGMPFQQQIQKSFGKHDISNVRSVTGGTAKDANAQMGSLAYASGDAISFKEGPSLHTAAHEAAHIVQQRGGVQLKSGIGQVGDQYEVHADQVADLVAQGKSAEGLLDKYSGEGSHCAAVQHKPGNKPAPDTKSNDIELPPMVIDGKNNADNQGKEIELAPIVIGGKDNSPNQKPVSDSVPKDGKKRVESPGKGPKQSFRYKHVQIKHSAEDEKPCPKLDFKSGAISQVQDWYSARFRGLQPKYAGLTSKKSEYIEAHKKWQANGGMSVTPAGLKSQIGDKKELDRIKRNSKVSKHLNRAGRISANGLDSHRHAIEGAGRRLKTQVLKLKKTITEQSLTEMEERLSMVLRSVEKAKARTAMVNKYANNLLAIGTNIVSTIFNPTSGIAVFQSVWKLGFDVLADLTNADIDRQFSAEIRALDACVGSLKEELKRTSLMAAISGVAAEQSLVAEKKSVLRQVMKDRTNGIRDEFDTAGNNLGELVPGKKGRVAGDMVKSMPFIRELAGYSKSTHKAASNIAKDGGLDKIAAAKKELAKFQVRDESSKTGKNMTEMLIKDKLRGDEIRSEKAKKSALTNPVEAGYRVAKSEEALMESRSKEFSKLASHSKDAQRLIHKDVNKP